jgi:hypothetical protein
VKEQPEQRDRASREPGRMIELVVGRAERACDVPARGQLDRRRERVAQTAAPRGRCVIVRDRLGDRQHGTRRGGARVRGEIVGPAAG